jgi:hypothetical protein
MFMLEELGATIVNAITGLATLGLVIAFTTFSSSYWTDANKRATMSNTLVTLQRDATTADVIFIPQNDAAGASNTDGHELAFYKRNPAITATDPLGRGHFWVWCYKATSSECSATQTTNTLAGYWATYSGGALTLGTTLQNEISGLDGFGASNVQGSTQLDALAEVEPYASAHPGSCAVQTYHWGYTGAIIINGAATSAYGIASNTCTVYRVTVTSQKTSLTIPITNNVIPTEQVVTTGTATPTPNPIAAGPALTFRAPVDVAQTATFTETDYGAKTGVTPAQVYSIVDACTSTPSPGTSESPVLVTPSNTSTGLGSTSVTPVIGSSSSGWARQTCSLTATDNVGQTATSGISIGTTYAPSSNNVVVNYSGSSQTVPLQVSEENYATPPPTGRGGFGSETGGTPYSTGTKLAAAGSAGCSNLAFVNASEGSVATDYTETENWQVTTSSTGTCTVKFYDKYGQLASSTVTVISPTTYPPEVMLPYKSGSTIINKLTGIACGTNVPIAADGSGNPYTAATSFGDGRLTTNANGCLKWNGSLVNAGTTSPSGADVSVNEASASGTFAFKYYTCTSTKIQDNGWVDQSQPNGGISLSGLKIGTCSIALTDSSNAITSNNTSVMDVMDTLVASGASGQSGYNGNYNQTPCGSGLGATQCYDYNFAELVKFNADVAPTSADTELTMYAGKGTVTGITREFPGQACSVNKGDTISGDVSLRYGGDITYPDVTGQPLTIGGSTDTFVGWTTNGNTHTYYNASAPASDYTLIISVNSSAIYCSGKNWEIDWSFPAWITQG